MKIETQSTTWLRIQQHIEARRAELIQQLSSTHTPFDETQALRGRLAELQLLAELPASDTTPAEEIPTPNYGI